jgi:adenylate cyclase
MPAGSQSRLAVILHADVADSTALVRRDERLAHDCIQAAFRSLAKDVERHGGSVSEIRGDALLAEFARASDAVLAALQAQARSAECGVSADDEVAPRLRIGVALGEVVVADDTVTGAGVVLAQRLEQLATPGGVCISGAIREAVPDRLGLSYSSLGEKAVKGFEEPVRVYRVWPGDTPPVHHPAPERPEAQRRRVRARAPLLLLGAALALLAAVVAAWLLREGEGDATRGVVPARKLEGMPSIAVLPFDNVSDDPEQEYFSDGLTSDLITDLSRISGLLVIARNSSFAYKGQAMNVQHIGRDLGARYVLEGSVRRVGARVRINAQLIDASSGAHVWADRYDRQLTDVLDLQDEVTRTIVSALAVSLSGEDELRRERRGHTSPDAYDLLLRGNERLHRFNAQDMAVARSFYEKAVALDSRYARAHANLALTHAFDLMFGWSRDREDSFRQSMVSVERALELDDRIPQAHFTYSNALAGRNRISDAIAAAHRAIEVDPNYADAYAQLAGVLTYAGRLEEAHAALEKGMRLNPRYSAAYLWLEGRILFLQERYAQARTVLEEALSRNPDFDQLRLMLAATYARMGLEEDAQWQVAEILASRPEFTVSAEAREKPFQRERDKELYLTSLRRAGLPE